MEDIINEDLLQFLWKFQKYNTSDTKTTDNKSILVLDPGVHNEDSGPDFKAAKIIIDGIEWHGSVEIHKKASDWLRHKHQADNAYTNVILHVTWECDLEIDQLDCLELKKLANSSFLENYANYLSQKEEVICSSQLHKVSGINYFNMLDKVLVERLKMKADRIHEVLIENANDWQEVTYQTLGYNLGFGLNKMPFSKLTKILPYRILQKYQDHQTKLEALLFGAAGFLINPPMDEYHRKLIDEFNFLREKHKIEYQVAKHEWQYAKTRPGNFPSVRIALFAQLIYRGVFKFDLLVESGKLERIESSKELNLTDYWVEHYDFGKKRKKPLRRIASSTYQLILINTLAPILAAYSKHIGDVAYMDKATELLIKLKPEQNRFTKKWATLGKKANNAFESQALMQLFQHYCTMRKCLSCNIGVELLSK